MTDTISGKRVLIVGVGSIGRAIGHQLRSNGMEVEGVGRTARGGDRDFGHVFGVDELLSRLPGADYVVLITPYTDQTHQLFGEAEFNAMQSHARFINLGRGKLVVEDALLVALTDGKISAAALDVFVEEPLPARVRSGGSTIALSRRTCLPTTPNMHRLWCANSLKILPSAAR